MGLNIYIPTPPGRPIGAKNKSPLKRIISHGYVHLFKPNHIEAMKTGYVREHRMIMSDFIGRKLLHNEEVHHKNEIKNDNRIDNLEIKIKPAHTSYHHKGKLKPRKGSEVCHFYGCDVLQKSKYGLCRKHYKLSWHKGILEIHENPELLES